MRIYLSMYVLCMYVCMHIRYMCEYVYLRMCMCIYVHAYAYVYVCTCICVYTYVNTYMCMYICTYFIVVCSRTCMYIRI